MGKRDAFGNEIEDKENPLDAMGWKIGDDATAPAPASVGGQTTAPVPSAPPIPAAPANVSAPPAMPSSPPPTMPSAARLTPTMPSQLPNITRSSGFDTGRIIGRLVGLVIFLAIAGGITAAVLAALDTAKNVTNSFSIPKFTTPEVNLPGITTPAPGKAPTPSTPAKTPSGLQPRSLARAEAFAPVLVKIREQGTRAQTLRLDATRVSANILDSSDVLRIVSVTWEGNVQTIKTSSRLTGSATVSLNGVSSKSPSRAPARAAKLLGRPATSFNYMVLTSFAGKAQWIVYFKDGKYVRASLDGRSVQKVN
jgi:hypothetical protein